MNETFKFLWPSCNFHFCSNSSKISVSNFKFRKCQVSVAPIVRMVKPIRCKFYKRNQLIPVTLECKNACLNSRIQKDQSLIWGQIFVYFRKSLFDWTIPNFWKSELQTSKLPQKICRGTEFDLVVSTTFGM